jgi:hypothetical protein
MKFHLALLPAVLMAAGVFAGHSLQPPRPSRESEGMGLVRALRSNPLRGVQRPENVLSQRPANPGLAKLWDFLQRLEKTPVTEFPAFWEELEEAGNIDQNPAQEFSPQETLLAQRWAELDPAAAAAFFTGGGGRGGMLRTVFAVWSLTDPDGAFSALSKLSSPEKRTLAAAGIFAAASDDPASLIAWARRCTFLEGRKLKEDDFNSVIPPDALRRAFDLDPAACRELTVRTPDWFRARLDALIVLKEAEASLPDALRRIDTAGPAKDAATRFLLELMPLADSQPEKILAITEHLTSKLGNGWLKSQEYADLEPALLALARAAPDRVHRILADAASPDIGTDVFRAQAACTLYGTDPRLALQVAPPGSPWITEFMGGPIVTSVLPGSPQEILDLVRGAPSSMMRDSLMREAFARLRAESPDSASQWVDTLPPGELKDVAGVTLTNFDAPAMVADLSRAVVSANTGGPDAANLERVRQLTKNAVRSDPAALGEQLMSLPEGAARDTALQTAATWWASASTSDALKWAESLPPGPREKAVAGVLETWAASEPAAASEYLAAHLPTLDRDTPVSAFARGLAGIDPAASLEWAATVTDPVLRAGALQEIAAGWLKKNSGAAREGLQTIPGLTPAERQQLTNSAVPP